MSTFFNFLLSITLNKRTKSLFGIIGIRLMEQFSERCFARE
jgi:hypothetical protein